MELIIENKFIDFPVVFHQVIRFEIQAAFLYLEVLGHSLTTGDYGPYYRARVEQSDSQLVYFGNTFIG